MIRSTGSGSDAIGTESVDGQEPNGRRQGLSRSPGAAVTDTQIMSHDDGVSVLEHEPTLKRLVEADEVDSGAARVEGAPALVPDEGSAAAACRRATLLAVFLPRMTWLRMNCRLSSGVCLVGSNSTNANPLADQPCHGLSIFTPKSELGWGRAENSRAFLLPSGRLGSSALLLLGCASRMLGGL